MSRMMRNLISMLLIATLLGSCGGKGDAESTADTAAYALPETLRIATIYSPLSYFLYRDEAMGYDYALAAEFAKEKGLVLETDIAPSLEKAIEMVNSGKADVVAYQIPVNDEYKARVRHCGPTFETTQVLVQRRGTDSLVTDVTQLPGRDIYVVDSSKYHQRLRHLNDELGGGIRIHTLPRDSIVDEDLIEMVNEGKIPMTVIDSDLARIDRTYYPRLDITVALSFPQKARWAVAPDRQWLGDSIDTWLAKDKPRERNLALLKTYFEAAKQTPTALTYTFHGGQLSPYDNLFRQYADNGRDWRLLGAICFVESRFDNNVTSWAGARGIMQIMPSTARANGIDPETLSNPEVSIRLAAKLLNILDRTMRPYVKNPAERAKFVLAAYNAGAAHIIDAIALAKKHGYDPTTWDGNVAEALRLKSNPTYYNDEVVRYGYFRGTQTIEYVNAVMRFYQRVIANIHH